MFIKRDFATLTSAASQLERAANVIETGYNAILGALDQADGFVDNLVGNMREQAETLRGEAQEQANSTAWSTETDGFSSDTEVTRAEKIDFIRSRVAAVGITGSKWDDNKYTDAVSDKFIDTIYRGFGGK